MAGKIYDAAAIGRAIYEEKSAIPWGRNTTARWWSLT